ncbi:MAG: 4-alpha-glucanotransferase [Treponema sp.]|jgi:4-alpha-glucanotransferase|nr:4-alpha-glucanotransferase [Treponema sp.]
MQLENEKRGAGILLPVFSLPSNYGIGSFGDAAYKWIDFLSRSGQTYWQVLPLHPTSYGDSPYQSVSAFAGNPYFIDLDALCNEGLLTYDECNAQNFGQDSNNIDYHALYQSRDPLLRKAFNRYKKLFPASPSSGLELFRHNHAAWIEPYALFMALKVSQGNRSWIEWDDALKRYDEKILLVAKSQLIDEIEYHIFVQYLFFKQWSCVKNYANEKGIKIIGDIPLYVALDSVDVWSRSDLFLLDKQKLPIAVAGCPPDSFSATGQLWGNPLYNWEVSKNEGYTWWLSRLSMMFSLYDVLRIDHFRGLESFYTIPFGEPTAENGTWQKGPGISFINAIKQSLENADIIAEDLGYLTPEVRELVTASGYPSMKVLQFAFDSREESDYMPYKYGPNSVVYTGTHDNETTRAWFSSASPQDAALALSYFGLQDNTDGHWGFIRAALSSVSNRAIIPFQDYLNLGSEARINTPSTLGGNNWRWRMNSAAINPKLEKTIAELTKLYGR